jgi:hypothetical protein
MEYLMKLYVDASSVCKETKRLLLEEYGMKPEDVEVEELGKIVAPDGRKLVWLRVRDEVWNSTDLLALEYDGSKSWDGEYRVFGFLKKECPTCGTDKGPGFGAFCRACGTKLVYRLP